MRGDQRSVLTAAIRRGWVATNTRGGHIKLTHPSGAIYFTGRSPSDGCVSLICPPRVFVATHPRRIAAVSTDR